MTKKLLISILIIFFTIIYILAKKIGAKHITPIDLITHKPITPENTVIAFDLHDVIVNYNYQEIIKTFFSYNGTPGKLKLILYMLNPLIWWSIAKNIYNHAVVEQYIIGLGKKHKTLKSYIPLGIKIANCQTINPKMLNLIKNLKEMGYTIHLFSNIGKTIYLDLKKKSPQIFENFDKTILPSEENGYLRKPHKDAFKNYIKEFKANNPIQKQIIFIDDKTKNVQKASKQGIIGLHFINHPTLVKEFKKIGILPY